MYALEGSDLRRSLLVNNGGESQIKLVARPVQHAERIKNRLRELGLNRYELWSSESRYLPHVIHPEEHIGGVVFGYKEGSLVMMVATDQRVMILDKKPLFVNKDELNYDMLGGVRFTHAGIGSTVTLHTRIEEHSLVTFNKTAAERFVSYIEAMSLDNASRGVRPPRFTY